MTQPRKPESVACRFKTFGAILGGSWVGIGGVTSMATIVTRLGGLVTPFMTTHEPPSKAFSFGQYGRTGYEHNCLG